MTARWSAKPGRPRRDAVSFPGMKTEEIWRCCGNQTARLLFGAGMLEMNAARITRFEKPSPPDPQDQASSDAVRAIGRALRPHYSDLVQAPLPDKLLQLLAKLDEEQNAPEAKGSGNAVG